MDHLNISYENVYVESFSSVDSLKWTPNIPENWELLSENGKGVYHLIEKGTFGEIRKPTSYSIINNIEVTDFELTVEAKCLVDSTIKGRDIVVIFGFQDDSKFYYCHISNSNHAVHNIIGLVNEKDRERISTILKDSTKARLTDYSWHKIKIFRNSSQGLIEVFVDDMNTPIHSIFDKTFLEGKVGLGSFDDTAKFKNFEIKFNSTKTKFD